VNVRCSVLQISGQSFVSVYHVYSVGINNILMWICEAYIDIFLTSALVGGELSASSPGRFTPGKDIPVPIV
jgi:hypothetical protein